MAAPILAFFATPAGQALLGSLIVEAPKAFGKVIAILANKGHISPEEIVEYAASWQDAADFYQKGPQP